MKNDVFVKETMNTKVVTAKSTITVKEAAKIMKKKSIGNIIIGDKKPIGILTESDILKKVVAEDLQASKVLAKDVMSTPIIVIEPYMSIEKAMKTMNKYNIRRLPVVEKGKLIGIITQKDILRVSPILMEICREWGSISSSEKSYKQKRIVSGKCEDCGTFSDRLVEIDGRLLCDDCADASKYNQ